MRTRRVKRLAAGALVALGLSATAALAADGGLDPSFDGDGRTISDVTSFDDAVADLAIDGQGRIVVVGTAFDMVKPNRAVVARYNADGSLDKGFSNDGIALIGWSAESESEGASGVAIDSQGRIVVGGEAGMGTELFNFAAARFLPNGEPDTSFDGDGRATLDMAGNSTDLGEAGAVDSQDRVLVGGWAVSGGAARFAVARFGVSGAPDKGFDVDGKVLTDFPGATNAYGSAIEIDSSGRPVVAGSASTASSSEFAVARYNENGSLDSSFDGDGRATLDFGSVPGELAAGMALDASGAIVLAGQAGMSTSYVAEVGRLLPSGAPDPSFDGDGRATVVVPDYSYADRVEVDPAGRIVVAGGTGSNSSEDALLARLLPSGGLDPDFGSSGVVREDFLAASARADALGVDQQGRYVMAGTASGGKSQAFGLARFLASYPGPAESAKARCKGKVATLVGTSKRDRLKGTKKRDVIAALGGNDLIRGLSGNDLICAGAGKDLVKAGAGADQALGEGGNDRLFGESGKDKLFGQKGKDLLVGGPSRDVLRGGAGRDTQRP